MKRLYLLLIMLILVPAAVQGLAIRSNGDVSINEPIDDDLLVSGGTIVINAPVRSVLGAGGEITINAPVQGDVIAAGGNILVNNQVDGKIVAAGGTVQVNSRATNAVLAGGQITLGSNASIVRDAIVSGDTVRHAGTVGNNLTVQARSFENVGSAGTVQYQPTGDVTTGFEEAVDFLSLLLSLLVTIGFFLLGIALIAFFPGPFFAVEAEARQNPVIRTLAGWVVIVVALIIMLITAVTVILLPFALLIGIVLLVAVLLTSLILSSSVGKLIERGLRQGWNPLVSYTLGFVILHILFAIPFFIGGIIRLIVVGLGIGAMAFAFQAYQQRIRS
jgi:hypothetical protein